MSVPAEVVLTLALGLLIAVASVVLAWRLSSQLREAQARLLNEVAARQKEAHLLAENDAERARLLESHEAAAARLAQDRDVSSARADEAIQALDEARREIERARTDVPKLTREIERLGEALARAKEAEAAAIASARDLEGQIAALKAAAEDKARELSATRELLAAARSDMKGAHAELRRTAEHLEASQKEALALGERAARLEKQLSDALAASKLERQLLDTLGAAQAQGAELGKALHKAESDAWREKTAKEASLLEARALREDVKRVQVRLAGELARREELARQWAEVRASVEKQREAPGAAGEAPERRLAEMERLEKELAPPPIPVEAPPSIPAAARSVRPRSPTPPGKRAGQAEEPKKVAAWWCQICGKGGTQLSTACKHQWVQGEMV
jgi:chromosome segregation protein